MGLENRHNCSWPDDKTARSVACSMNIVDKYFLISVQREKTYQMLWRQTTLVLRSQQTFWRRSSPTRTFQILPHLWISLWLRLERVELICGPLLLLWLWSGGWSGTTGDVMVNLLENWLIINIISIRMKNQIMFRIKITNFVPILDKRMQTVK